MEHMYSMFPKSWVHKDYKARRETILMEREKALLPSTQLVVQEVLARRENIKLLDSLKCELRQLRIQIHNVYASGENKTQKGKEQLMTLNIQVKENRRHKIVVKNAINGNSHAVANAEKPVYTYKCPADDCRGFLNTSNVCGLCKVAFCKKCNKPHSDTHVCNDEDVQTAKLLKDNTKPCPACGTLIFKVSGCNQMFCINPSCLTAFNWQTGRIETQHIHNPHYYELVRQGGLQLRQPGDTVCGGLPELYTLRIELLHGLVTDTKITDKIYNYHREARNVNRVELFNNRVDMGVNNTALRVKYMLNEIDEATWRKKLHMNEKQLNKRREVYQVLSMYDETITHLFNDFVGNRIHKNAAKKLIADAQTLTEYCNKCLEAIGKRYNNRTYIIRYY